MIGNLIEIGIVMWIIACLASAPLGYFIYMYTMKTGEPFGDIEPHGDSESKVLDLAEQAIHAIKGFIAKK